MNTLAVKDNNTLELIEHGDSWSQFSRENSTVALADKLAAGGFVEINDKKFQGNPIVLLRKSDLEKLVTNSRATSRIKKMLFSISKTVMSFSDVKDPTALMEAVLSQASLAVELAETPKPLYQSSEELLADEEDVADEVNLPKSKEELTDGVRKK